MYPAKAAPPFGSSNNELHSCRLSIAEKRGANNQQEQSALISMKVKQVPSQYSKRIGEVQATIEVWVRAKAPSHRVSCESSAALQLFKQ
jgi:hypothetical protein